MSELTNGARFARQKWAAGEPAYGAMLTIPTPYAAEIVAAAGADFVVIDTQHGLMGPDLLFGIVAAVRDRTTPIVRVNWNSPMLIMKALDAGAEGVVVPLVNNAEEAKAAADACRYPPRGNRSWGPSRTALGRPGLRPSEDDADVLCCVMIETVEGLANVEEIAAVPGVNGLFCGPSDLSLSMFGDLHKPGQTEEGAAAIQKVAAVAEAHGLLSGTAVVSTDAAVRLRNWGYRMVAVHNDTGLLTEAASAAFTAAREG